nr:cytochrome P450 CYP749A22-like [Ipomoea batatas]
MVRWIYSKELLVANEESKNSSKISIEEVADEYKAFCYVGCVATTSLLGWAVHKLSRDKNLQERARKEVIQMFGCENPNLDGIAKLKIVDEIIEDCQRQYPLLPFTKGSVQEESVAFKSSSCYGAGTHLGLNFAKIEAKVVLSMILRRFAFTLSPSYIHSPVQGFTVTPKHGIRVILHKLEQEGSQMTRIVKTVGVIATVGVAAWAHSTSIHCIWKILFVSKYKQHSITELIFIQHPMQFISCLHNTISIIAINNKDEALHVLEIVPPEWMILSWPPTSQTMKLMFLYSIVSTLKPMVGMVVTISPSLSLYNMVVLPAASRPTIRICISFMAKSLLKSLVNVSPIALSS